MAAVLLRSVLLFLLYRSFVCLSADDDPVLNHFSGETVTLPCQGPTAPPIALLDWSRPELKDDGYVFFYRDGKVYESYQHQRYRGRVRLLDPDMRNGTVSITVSNVIVNDTGTYECTMFLDTGPGQKPQLKHRLTLRVQEKREADTENNSTTKNVNVPVAVVLSLLIVILIIIVVVILRYKYKKSWLSAHNVPEGASPLEASSHLV